VIGWLRSRSDVFHRDVAALHTEGAWVYVVSPPI